VLVGFEGSDDAGVYRISDDLALVQTLDFFTPIVDAPFTFARIAAANALSAVYAMGGRPLTAMNIVAFPVKKFPLDVLSSILEGGLDILGRAGVQLLGGHSVEDQELKYGLSVTGTVHPRKIIRNSGIVPGDALVLTKSLGTGIIGTAITAGMAPEGPVEAAVESMTSLNDRASDIMRGFDVHACTDVTGFGLAGHLKEMLAGESLELAIESASLPLLPGMRELSETGLVPAGLYRNRDGMRDLMAIGPEVPRHLIDAVFDPQTSGGLVIALPGSEAASMIKIMRDEGIGAASLIALVRQSSVPVIRLI
jgi:selenide,water dikinase